MRQHIKKMIAGILTLAIALTAFVTVNPTTVHAYGWTEIYASPTAETLTKDTPFEFQVKNPSYSRLQFNFNMPASQKAGFSVSVFNSEGRQLYDTVTISADDSGWSSNSAANAVGYSYTFSNHDEIYLEYYNFPKDTLTFRFTFTDNAQAKFYVYAYSLSSLGEPKFSQSTYSVGVGCTTTLKLENDTALKFTSSNKKIATVSSKGVVTGKKKGTVTIKATTKSGTPLSCTVTVTANAYAGTKLKKSEVESGSYEIKPYNAKFDSKGNLVIKYMGINNTGKKVKLRISGIKAADNTLLMGGANEISVTLPKKSSKSYTIKVKKSKLIVKKYDLTNGVSFNSYAL